MASEKEKKVSKTVSLFPSMWEWLEEAGDGNRSRPIYEFVEAEMAGSHAIPDAKDPECLVKLCEMFRPSYVPDMRDRCEGEDQPKLLEELLRLFAVGAIRPKANPEPRLEMAAEDGLAYPAKKKPKGKG